MPWDCIRARTNPDAIATALNDYALGVTSIDGIDVTKVSTDYVAITIQYTA